MKFLVRYRFFVLLVGLSLFLLGLPLATLVPGPALLLEGIQHFSLVAMFLSAVVAVSEQRRHMIVSIVLAAAVVVLYAVLRFYESRPALALYHVTAMAFILYTILGILRFALHSRRVTTNVICAALSVYLSLGVLWCFAYSLIMVYEPGAFRSADDLELEFGVSARRNDNSVDVVYFSLTALTTLGFGDITPATPLARILVVLEALTGQLFLVTLVGWLVGLHVKQTGGGEP